MPANDLTITAEFEINEYTLTWVVDGVETKVKYDYDAAVVALAAPEKVGYTFTGWDVAIPEKMPANDLTLVAQWTINKYTVTYKVDGDEYEVETYDFGAAIEILDDLEKEGYTFSGWTPASLPATMPAENLEVVGTFSVNTYNIIYETYFDDVTDPSEFETEINSYTYGIGVALLDEPTDRISATFDGWYLSDDFSGSAVTSISTTQLGDITLYAKWDVREYTVTFEVDGVVQETKQVKHSHELGTLPVAPEKPGYIFISWRDSNEVEYLATTTITADVTLEAFYIANIVHDEASLILALSAAEITEIEFSNDVELTGDLVIDRDGFVLDTKGYYFNLELFNIYFNQTATYQEYELTGLFVNGAIYIDNTNGHYELDGMSGTNVTVHVINSYQATVILTGQWGNVLINDTNGKTIIAAAVNNVTVGEGAKLELEENAEVDKLQTKKDAEVKINDSATIGELDFDKDTDVYFGNEETLTVVFMVKGKIAKVEKVKQGGKATAPELDTTGHTFNGWDKEFDEITENLTVTANITVNKYSITYYIDGVQYGEVEYHEYGEPVMIYTPLRDGYRFIGWSPNTGELETMPAENLELTGSYERIYFEVEYISDEETYHTDSVEYHTKATKPTDPEKEGYLFLCWSTALDGEEFDFDNIITKDLALYAKWDKIISIEEVYSKPKETKVVITGVVSGFTDYNSQFKNYDKVWIEDETGSITVYRNSFPSDLAIGDKYTVAGETDNYYGLVQIKQGADLIFASSGNELIASRTITDLSTLEVTDQASRINLVGEVVSVTSTGQEMVVKVGEKTITIRAISNVSTNPINAHLLTAIVGETVELKNIHVDWHNEAQLLPTLIEQVVFKGLSNEKKLQLDVVAIENQFDNKNFNMGEEVVLPLTGLHETTISWVLDPLVAIVDGKWMNVTEDTQVTLTATISLGELEEEVVLNVKVLFVKEIEYVKDAQIFYNFTTLTGKGNEYTEITLEELLTNEYFKSVSNIDKVYNGGDDSHVGMLKLGAGSFNGKFTLTLKDEILIKTVVMRVNGWQAGDKVSVNGNEVDLTLEKNNVIIFTLTEETNVITIESNKRALIYKLELYGSEAEIVEPAYYDVTFNYNDGGDNVVVKLLEDNTVDIPSEPIRTGFKFEGWFINLDDENPFNFDTIITANITLTAKWEELGEIISVPGEMDFEGSTGLTGSYQDNKSFTNNGIEYKYNRARNEDVYPIDNKGMLFQNNTGYLEFTVPTGMGQFTFQYRKAYTSSEDRKITVHINDVQAGVQLVFNSNEPLTFLFDVSILGVVKIKIQNDAGQVTIDNIIWSAYGELIPQPTKYDVIFNTDGGTPEPSVQKILENGIVTKPTDPTKSGFAFGGWYKEAELINEWNFTTDKVTSEITLYAKWKEIPEGTPKTYVETFGQRTSSGNYSGTSNYTSLDNGFIWSMKGRGDGTLDGNAWILGNAGDGSFVQVVATGGIASFSLDVVRYSTNTNARKLELFVNDVSKGTFDVSTNSDTVQKWTIDNINISGDITIKVVSINTGSRGATIIDNFSWVEYKEGGSQPEPTKYNVAFNSNGGSAVATISDIVSESTITKPNDPTKSGFVFDGWYKEAELTNEWNFETDIVTSNITLYAKWTKEQTGGDGPIESFTVTLAYPKDVGTKNMAAGNNAVTVGLDEDLFEVISIQRVVSPLHIGLNNSGEIRLYGSTDTDGNILKIVIDSQFEITDIKINFGGTVGSLIIKVDNIEKYSGTPEKNGSLEYNNLKGQEFSIQNKNSSTGQIYIKSIEITYSPKQ